MDGRRRRGKRSRPYALWRRKVGRRKQPVWELAAFPAGYVSWTTSKIVVDKAGTPIGERRDHYLYGSPTSLGAFESPDEFAWHAVWLMRGKPRRADGRPDCRCRYCGGGGKQRPVTVDLKAILRVCDGEGRGGGGPRDGVYDVEEDEDEESRSENREEMDHGD